MQRFVNLYRDLLIYAEICLSMQRFVNLCRDLSIYAEICKTIQGIDNYSELCRSM